jgi:hypothetical protein
MTGSGSIATAILVGLVAASTASAHETRVCGHCTRASTEFAREGAAALSRIGAPASDGTVAFGYAAANPRPDLTAQIDDLGRARAAYCETHSEECAKASGH